VVMTARAVVLRERPASAAEGESEAEARTAGTEYEAARERRQPFRLPLGDGCRGCRTVAKTVAE